MTATRIWMSSSPAFDVFISYSRSSGAALAQMFRGELERQGIRVFLDVRAKYWGSFPDELTRVISSTPCVLVLLTKSCTEAKWMERELALAFQTQRTILVIRDASFELAEGQGLKDVWAQCMLLNHRPYMHEFHDEVVRQVVATIKQSPRGRTAVVRQRGAIVLVALLLGGGAYFGQALAPFGPKRSTDAAGSAGASADVESAHQPAEDSRAIPTAAGTGSTDVTVVQPATALPAPTLETESPSATDALPTLDAKAAGEAPKIVTPRRGRQRAAAKAPAAASWCYHKSGYDPTLGVERKECESAPTLEACERQRSRALAAGSLWTAAQSCTSCGCEPARDANSAL